MGIPSRCPAASAAITGSREAPDLRGCVRFFPVRGGVLMEARIQGLPRQGPGIFGFHIHAGESCAGEGFPETGGHLNPEGFPHPRHAGDLPPIFRYCGSRGYLAFVTDRFSLPDILGKTVVIHSGSDAFRRQPARDSGRKIGCGVIQGR